MANSAHVSAALANRLQRGLEWHRAGEIERAAAEYNAILRLAPRHPEALRCLGICKLQQNEVASAIELLRGALKVSSSDAATHANLGTALSAAGDLAAALPSFEHAVRLQPSVSGFHVLRADALFALGRASEALAAYDRAIELDANSFEAHNNRGNALRALADPEAALRAFDRASALAPNHPAPYNNRAGALLELRRPEDALAGCRQALALHAGYTDAWYNGGSALMDLGRHEDASGFLAKALETDAQHHKARFNLGLALQLLAKYEEAGVQFGRLLELQPEYPRALGYLVAARTHCCDWSGLDDLRRSLVYGVEAGRPVCDPFTFLAIHDDPGLQLRCAGRFASEELAGAAAAPPLEHVRAGGERIRVAYLSADFHDHATARLLIDVLERHDRSAFELTGISFGPDDGSTMRARVRKAFDRFLDVRQMSDAATLEMLRAARIDIAVDLKGFTAGSRIAVFARRAAPIQVSFLGYPGTLGAPFIDYLIADSVVVPQEHRAAYSESVVFLPNCYQPNDSTRHRPAAQIGRAEAGLPPDGFVYCSFNSSYKITLEIFAVWMRMLRNTPGSVLWLLHDNDAAVRNLRARAAEHGVEAGRLVFAPRVSASEHLARHRLADLFLDTTPVNAHTTASDALWMGLPVLTCAGAGFASRVAASALRAVGLPDLVTTSLEEYEVFGMSLATDRPRLAEIAERLERNRVTSPLFDAAAFRVHLEAAYRAMWERHQRAESPVDIRIGSQSETANDDAGLPASASALMRS